MNDLVIEAQKIPPSERHNHIFKSFDLLEGGNSIVIVNNHDPIPLLRQFEQFRGGEFKHEYLENGPQVWKLKITKKKSEGCCGFCGGE